MNNKKVKYLLIVAVIAVWATILYRVVGGLGSGPSTPAPSPPIARNDLKMTSDTFSLYADYPDPFLPEPDSSAADTLFDKKTSPPPTAADTPSASVPESPSSFIQLTGVIGNPQNRSRVAILVVRGKEYMVREKEKIEKIYVKKIDKDRVHILYKGESYIIVK